MSVTDPRNHAMWTPANGFAELCLREAPAVYGPRIFKCIVWDLDNTLWEGTLGADGPEGIAIRRAAVDAIEETDRRGILHSIACSNDYYEAMAALRRFGLEEYFLFPQMNRRRKCESIRRIAELLHIGLETMAFVGGEASELAEVQSAIPGITVIDAAECVSMAHRPECMVPLTEDSACLRQGLRQRRPQMTDLTRAIPLACESLIQSVLDFEDRPARRSLHQRPYTRRLDCRAGG